MRQVKFGLAVLVVSWLVGGMTRARADDATTHPPSNRQQVRDRLRNLQSYLDLLITNHQLTPDQYTGESQRVQQMRQQAHVDAQEKDPMSDNEKQTDFDLIGQINQEVSQWAVNNTAANAAIPNTVPVPTTTPAVVSSTKDGLMTQYMTLSTQYRTLDAQYIAALSANDFQTALSAGAQLEALGHQLTSTRASLRNVIGANKP